MKIIDITGQKFGLLTVQKRSVATRNTGALWICSCECGGETVVDSLKLRKGLTKSCGCRQNSGVARLSHGHAKARTLTYRSWKEMRQRCRNPNSTQWKWYGGRGILICDEWAAFEGFLKDMGERPIGKTIDRINGDGNYSKENCRWATPKQQAETNRGTFKPGFIPHNKGIGGLRTIEKVKGVA